MIYVTSPAMIVSHILPSDSNITDYQFQHEVNKCKELGVTKYIHDFNSSINTAKNLKQKHLYKGVTTISIKALMEYFSRVEMTIEPITEIKV